MKKPESLFKRKIMSELGGVRHSWFERIEQSSINGTPDILGCIDGMFIALEAKTDNNSHPTKLQAWNLQSIERAGGIGLCVRPSNWPEVLETLHKLSRRKK